MVKRGQSNGEYKAKMLHGLNSEFLAAWYNPPNCPLREHWLRGSGMVVWTTTVEHVAQCLFCKPGFQCRLQNMKAHESGKKHKERAAAWQQAQKNKAAWQKRLDKRARSVQHSCTEDRQQTPSCTHCAQCRSGHDDTPVLNPFLLLVNHAAFLAHCATNLADARCRSGHYDTPLLSPLAFLYL
eukprot:1139724-Pelagomonas_calceolata.AAC.3